MSKKSQEVIAAGNRHLSGVTRAASMAGRMMQQLEAEAERIAAEPVAAVKSLKLVAASDKVSALIKIGGLTVQVENGDFAVTMEGE